VCLALHHETFAETMDGVECVLTQASIEAMQRKELLKDWPADFQSAQLPNFSLAVDKPRIAPKAPKPPKAPTLPKALKIGAMTAKMKKSAMMKKKAIAVATASAIVPSDASVSSGHVAMATASAIVPSDASVSSGHASMATASAIVPSDPYHVSVMLGLPQSFAATASDSLPDSFRACKQGDKLMQRSLIEMMVLYREAFPNHDIIDVNGMIAVPNDRNESVSWLDMVKRVPQHFRAAFREIKNREAWAHKVYHKINSIKADLTRKTKPTPNTFRELLKQIPESTFGNMWHKPPPPPPPSSSPPPPPPPPSPLAPPPPPHAS